MDEKHNNWKNLMKNFWLYLPKSKKKKMIKAAKKSLENKKKK